MPFSEAQIRAIAADRNRRLGREGARRYMHSLKHKTVEESGAKAWGGAKTVKKNRFGDGGNGVGTRMVDEPVVKAYESRDPRSRYSYDPGKQRRLGAAQAATGTAGLAALGAAGWGTANDTVANRKALKYAERSQQAGQWRKGVRAPAIAPRARWLATAAGGLGALYGTKKLNEYSRKASNREWW